MHGASANAGHHHLAPLLIVQENRSFHATKGMSHFVDDTVNQLVEIENGRNSLRGFLYALQVIHEIGGQRANGGHLIADDIGNDARTRSHRTIPLGLEAVDPHPCQY